MKNKIIFIEMRRHCYVRITLKQFFGSGSGSVLIRLIFVSRIRIQLNETDPDPGGKKSAKIMENFNKNQQKSLEYHTFFSKLLNLCLLT